MMQGRGLGIRQWLVAVVCVIALGVIAVFVYRTFAPKQDVVTRATPNAMPKAATPALASPTAATASSAAAAAAVIAEAQSQEVSQREAREGAIRIQQRLRAEEQARKAAQQEQAKHERCIDGQRMKRVENGWVQAGTC
jgi:hypothetical protein